MQFEKVAKRYKETTLSTMSVLDYTLLLLKECLNAVEKAVAHDRPRESIALAQEFLFELMGDVDQHHAGGKRLFHFYIYLNQCLVEYQLKHDVTQLQRVADYLIEMIAMWEATKPIGKRYSYKRHDLTT